MRKILRRCPPYEGSEPYLYLCFAEKDSEAVFPLLDYLYQRGVRIWYSTETTAKIEKLNHQQDRMDKASLLVIYLTDNARGDERVKNSLLYYQHGKPVIGIDTDDGDNELAFGLTAAAKHVNGRRGRSSEELEAELIRTEGFSQELIGEAPVRRSWMKKTALILLAAALLTAGISYYGYKQYGWFVTYLPVPETPTTVPTFTPKPTPSPTPTPSPSPTPTPTPTPVPTPSPIPDTVFFEDPELTEKLRNQVEGVLLTEESLAEVTELKLDKIPEDLSELAKLPNLTKLILPQSEVMKAADLLDSGLTIAVTAEQTEAAP